MSIVRDTVEKIEGEVAGDGSAIKEWTEAREVDFQELFQLARERAELSEIYDVELTAVMTFCFRWGYETAMLRNRQIEEKELGL